MTFEARLNGTTGTLSVYLKCPLGAAWIQFLADGDTPDWPHPSGYRWAIRRTHGETLIYAGPVCAVLTPPRLIRRESQGLKI